MKPQPNENDYANLREIIRSSGQISGYELQMLYSEGKDFCQFMQHRLNLLQQWLWDFVKFELQHPQVHGETVHLCVQTEGFDFIILASYTPQCEYILRLSYQETFIRSEMPELERIEGEDITWIEDSKDGFELIGEKDHRDK